MSAAHFLFASLQVVPGCGASRRQAALCLSLIHIFALLCEKLPFMAGADFTPEVAKVTDSKKVSDHHAIIPTMELAKADPLSLIHISTVSTRPKP